MVGNLALEARHRLRAEIRALRHRRGELIWVAVILLILLWLRQPGGVAWPSRTGALSLALGVAVGAGSGSAGLRHALVGVGSSWRAALPFGAGSIRAAILLEVGTAALARGLGLAALVLLLGGLTPDGRIAVALAGVAVGAVVGATLVAASGLALGHRRGGLPRMVEKALAVTPRPAPPPGARSTSPPRGWRGMWRRVATEAHPVRRMLLLAAHPERRDAGILGGAMALMILIGVLAGVAARKMGVPAGMVLLGIGSVVLVTGLLPTLAPSLPLLRPLPLSGRRILVQAVVLVSRPVVGAWLGTLVVLADRPVHGLLVVGPAILVHVTVAAAWVALLVMVPGSSLGRGLLLAGWAALVLLVGAALPVAGALLGATVTILATVGAVRVHRQRDLEVAG
jgi:hypothetical protein